jgi:release factor glutamine methyltransferase
MSHKQYQITVLINHITQVLALYEGQSHQYSWWIVQAITGHQQSYLLTHATITLTAEQEAKLHSWLDQLVHKHIPLQYLIGSVPFCDLEILVEPPTLIPRPETEQWCSELIDMLQPLAHEKLFILDLCSGSGCIALALAKALPAAQVYGVDIADGALALAKKNAVHNKISNVTFLHSDLFSELSSNFTFDLIVSNPPYIEHQVWHGLEPSVTQWEDKRALVAEDDGLAIIKKIIDGARGFIRANAGMQRYQVPNVWIEIGYNQGAVVQDYMCGAGMAHSAIRKDLAGKDRVVTGEVVTDVAINQAE